MNKIKYTCCPVCEAGIKEQIKKDKHTNGYWNEYIKFKCGHSLHWSPNFMDYYNDYYSAPCKYSKKEINKQTKRKESKEKLFNYIKKLNVDKKYIDKILNELQYI